MSNFKKSLHIFYRYVTGTVAYQDNYLYHSIMQQANRFRSYTVQGQGQGKLLYWLRPIKNDKVTYLQKYFRCLSSKLKWKWNWRIYVKRKPLQWGKVRYSAYAKAGTPRSRESPIQQQKLLEGQFAIKSQFTGCFLLFIQHFNYSQCGRWTLDR